MTDTTWRCPGCGNASREPGFLVDIVDGGRLATEWAPGAPEESFLTGIRRPSRTWHIDASRCQACGRLDLFATSPVGD